MNKVTVRYLDLTDQDLMHSLFVAGDAAEDRIRDRALARLGIERREGEGHLRAWLRAMAEENGLPDQQPACPELRDAALSCSRWVWFLA